MDEKKILDMIKKSGENVDAPEEIQSRLNVCWKNSRWIKKAGFEDMPSGEQLRQSSHW